MNTIDIGSKIKKLRSKKSIEIGIGSVIMANDKMYYIYKYSI